MRLDIRKQDREESHWVLSHGELDEQSMQLHDGLGELIKQGMPLSDIIRAVIDHKQKDDMVMFEAMLIAMVSWIRNRRDDNEE